VVLTLDSYLVDTSLIGDLNIKIDLIKVKIRNSKCTRQRLDRIRRICIRDRFKTKYLFSKRGAF